MDGKIAVIYAINKEYDEQYNNGKWKYLDSEYRIIHRLCVNPLFQNKGVAKQTLSFVEKELKGEGVETIRLDVFSENPFAVIISKTDDKWVFCKHKERKDEHKNKTISVVNRYRSCMETYDRCL